MQAPAGTKDSVLESFVPEAQAVNDGPYEVVFED